MSDLLNMLRELVTLTDRVSVLKDDVDGLSEDVRELNERIVRLEQREELLLAKSRSEAMQAVMDLNGAELERVIALERRVKALERSDGSGDASQIASQ